MLLTSIFNWRSKIQFITLLVQCRTVLQVRQTIGVHFEINWKFVSKMYTEIWLGTWDPTTTVYRHFFHLIYSLRSKIYYLLLLKNKIWWVLWRGKIFKWIFWLIYVAARRALLFWIFVRNCHDPHAWNNEGINLPTNSKEL